MSWRSSPATPRPAPPSPNWCGWPEPGGRSRNAFKPPRTRPAWTTTRSAGATPGTGTQPCRCSRWRSSRSPQLKGGTSGCGQLSRTPAPHDHHGSPGAGDLIALTAGEIRRLLTNITHPQHPGEHHQRWSRWRRSHQARLRKSPLPATTATTYQPAAVVLGSEAKICRGRLAWEPSRLRACRS